ncbi:cytochrome c oxidase subunit II [Thermaerobacter marianensis DSM 12885]|uniref:Cytochrome aa3 subunit 2 n=1 Tax=Thermaerobacter marianensis (strain ATCC 700841 / DSM 12885 / JCM 10246 / 7p75a) TaxID=644966 RepID=E6SM52_THEM7|nr:cytochrome c oxidase subunit II [Thermaerobacter marianensis]ADU50382.1 cytochrome c oxidase subunit II [Thermaerobacter marianensis DSM 12885]
MHVDRYEKMWIWVSAAFLLALVLVLAYTTCGMGIHLPGSGDAHAAGVDHGTAAPAHVTANDPPFTAPGVRAVGPNRYEVVMTAQVFGFEPNEIRIPRGATVDFVVTSKDVIHGFMIPGTTVNTMIIPGQVTHVQYTFDKPGEYTFFCHEYCGIGHHVMSGRIVVE